MVQPRRQTLPEDSETFFTVGVIGNGPFTYQWYQDGTPLVNDGRISGATAFELRFSKCLSTDNGRDHWVRVSNAHGYTDSAAARLTVTPGCQDRTYTSTTDFTDNGILINLNTGTSGEIRLNTTPKPLPYIWVPCTGRGTIARIDVGTGAILGEYRTAPASVSQPEPSRTAVDGYGNLWVANRKDNFGGRGSITRVGLVIGGVRGNRIGSPPNHTFEPDKAGEYLKPPFIYNTCVDRDGDGLIKTSMGLGHVLPWSSPSDPATSDGCGYAEDEAILSYVRVSSSGARALAVDANDNAWIGDWDNGVHEKLNGMTGEVVPGTRYPAEGNGLYGGYGAALDAHGVLWSVFRPPEQGMPAYFLRGIVEQGVWYVFGPTYHGGYGIAVCPKTQQIWTTSRWWDHVARYESNGLWLSDHQHGNVVAQGVCVDSADNVWVAHAQDTGTTIGHVRTDGNREWIGNVHLSVSPNILPGPTSLAVDSNGKIWVACYNGNNAMRLDPASGPIGARQIRIGKVDLVADLGDGSDHEPPYDVPALPYSYSDMTGFSRLAVTKQRGIWSFVHDGGVQNKRWTKLYWVANLPQGASLRVQVRAANNLVSLTGSGTGIPGRGAAPRQFTVVPASGVTFTPVIGRYLEIQVTLARIVGSTVVPSLGQLTVHCDDQ